MGFPISLPRKQFIRIAAAHGAIAAVVVCAYFSALEEMTHRWTYDPQYSHGWLVPAFALFLLWHRRGLLLGQVLAPSWWGLALIAAGAAFRLGGAYLFFDWLIGVSLLPTLAGLCLLLGGWNAFRWAWPAVAFLVFMVPLPYRLQAALGGPLQTIATVASTYALQTLGFPAVAQGNIIVINEGASASLKHVMV